MSFSEDAWARTSAAYETIRTMPFNRELAAGTLTRAQFEHYMVQDAHYLIGFARALAIAAAKAPDPDAIVTFCEAAREAVVVERALHSSFFAEWNITPEAFAARPVTPATHHYTAFLIATAYGRSYEVVLAALLPCFWIYAAVGRDILSQAAPDNPYQAWINTYGGEAFGEAVRSMIAATDAAAATASPAAVEAMHDAYRAATRLEYLFWDGAYRLEAWPL